MRADFNKWWLLPFGILVSSTLVALGIIVFEPPFIGRSYAEVAQQTASKPTETREASADCAGASADDYACHQKRYQALVRDSSVKAAFTELKEGHAKNEFVKSNCHQMTHVIGRAAAERYGDVPTTYAQGDSFCWSGYYHGAMEAVVAKVGADKVLDEADTLCAGLREDKPQSFHHFNCVHGLGHGFMVIHENELFESLQTCDALSDDWEKDSCYNGVFMENIRAEDNPDHPSKYFKADRPLYPCTDVDPKYRKECYVYQSSHALKTQGNNFVKVFKQCATVEDGSRQVCYKGLGRAASGKTNLEAAKTKALCMLGQNYEARSNCVIGAAENFTAHYESDTQAKALCETFPGRLRTVCLGAVEEYYKEAF